MPHLKDLNFVLTATDTERDVLNYMKVNWRSMER